MIDLKKTKFYTTVAVLLLLLVGSTLSNENNCWKYGDCDPGPNCENYEDNHCWNCHDGGFLSKDKVEDGVIDCKDGSDESYGGIMVANNKSQKYGRRLCKQEYKILDYVPLCTLSK